jgi:hypothetical protein
MWLGTPSDALFIAAQVLSSSRNANLTEATLKDFVLHAKSQVVKHSRPEERGPSSLTERFINEGILSILIFVTSKVGRVQKPSHPFDLRSNIILMLWNFSR